MSDGFSDSHIFFFDTPGLGSSITPRPSVSVFFSHTHILIFFLLWMILTLRNGLVDGFSP